jgi:hypothetical protein
MGCPKGELLEAIGSKWLIFVNSIFLVAGIVLIAAGAVAMTTFADMTELVPVTAFYGLIGLGVNVFFLAIVGFIVACYEIKKIEICYAVITFAFAIALVVGGAALMSVSESIAVLVAEETANVESPVNKILACTWEMCCNIAKFGSVAAQELVSIGGGVNRGEHPSCDDRAAGLAPVCEALPPTFDPGEPLCATTSSYNDGFQSWAMGHVDGVAYGTLALGGIFFVNFIAAVIDVCNDEDSSAATAAFG